MRLEISSCLVDDFNRFTWSVFVRTKDEKGGNLIAFSKAIQLKINYVIASIRSHHGTKIENSYIEGFYP